jgi:putative Mg2+ transporter-C (MgtC) family protein
VLGVDRDLRHKPAGLRVHALVALGAALVTVVGVQIASAGGAMDPTSVTGVVSGAVAAVGFLGGGVIVRGQDEMGVDAPRGDPARGRRVHGLTTAASIWMAACLGIAAGVGLWPAVLGGFAFTLAILVGGAGLERTLHGRLHPHADGGAGPRAIPPSPHREITRR